MRTRPGHGLESAAQQARRVIHDNDVERLKQLLAEYPALLSWKDDDKGRGLLGVATSAFGDASDAQREEWFTRAACAELLIDAGAVVMPSVCESLLRSRDVALAFAVINRHFDVADFLLEHGADINTNWNSHEPASILHHLVFLPNPYESMRFLIDRGIDRTIKDYRWNSTAQGWAFHALNNRKMAQWLEEASVSSSH